MGKDKFLVALLKSINERQVFFFIWAAIAGSFALLMYSFYRNTQRRNFKESDGSDLKSKSVVKYESKLPK